LAEIADRYDAIVFDQWGVLHDGTSPYPKAVEAVQGLADKETQLAVLSNSGKRSDINADRIAAIGFGYAFSVVMTSGEALWRDFDEGRITHARLFAIERAEGDAATWAAGLDVDFTTIDKAEAVLLMGLPDGATDQAFADQLARALANTLPIYCSNPDRLSPRAGGQQVVSPGTLAHAYRQNGGEVAFYGKPYLPVFEALQRTLDGQRFLMIGDSLEHDIAGGAGAGWDTLLVEGGLYADAFAKNDPDDVLRDLCAKYDAPRPTYRMESLS